MIGEDCEFVPKEVLSPFSHGGRDGMQFSDIGGSMLHSEAK